MSSQWLMEMNMNISDTLLFIYSIESYQFYSLEDFTDFI